MQVVSQVARSWHLSAGKKFRCCLAAQQNKRHFCFRFQLGDLGKKIASKNKFVTPLNRHGRMLISPISPKLRGNGNRGIRCATASRPFIRPCAIAGNAQKHIAPHLCVRLSSSKAEQRSAAEPCPEQPTASVRLAYRSSVSAGGAPALFSIAAAPLRSCAIGTRANSPAAQPGARFSTVR